MPIRPPKVSPELIGKLARAGIALATMMERARRGRCIGCGDRPRPFSVVCEACAAYLRAK